MAYQALYRKWRPAVFEDVYGQDAIVTTLKNQIAADRIGHAYLFCGTRGTGKTTLAKIFARAVNCEHAAERGGSPCNECAVCRSILSESSMNVFEIDAASNNSVEDIRRIKEEVEYPPVEGRFKVYIIDEVHMLSTSAFNALLKTLEEPPAYVIFILATTDPQKVPATILSRCQRYDFKRIPSSVIAARLSELCAAEGKKAEDRAICYIAKCADGSMRDALSLLDRCFSFLGDRELSYKDTLEVLGAADITVFSELYRAICSGDIETALRTVAGIMDGAADLGISAMVVPLPAAEDDVARLSDWLKSMLSKLSGLVYLGEDNLNSHEKAFEILLSERGLPQVFISGRRFQEHLGIVRVDMASGFQAAVDSLYELGHRRMAVCGPKIPYRKLFQLQTYDRIPLLCEAVRARVPLRGDFVFEGRRGSAELGHWLKWILNLPERPSAILCADDEEAGRIMEMVRESGGKIPGELSVIGYGDTGRVPQLSSIRHPWIQTGRAAVEMIAESRRRSIPVNQLDRTLPAPLVIRDSVGRIPIP